MTVLAYVFIVAAILFFAGVAFGGGDGEKPYAFLLIMLFTMGISGVLMSLGVLGLIPA